MLFILMAWVSLCTSQSRMMTSSNGRIFRVTGLLCGEFTGSPVNSPRKGQWRGVWCFLWSAPEPTMEQTMETPVIWDAIALIMTSLKIALDGVQIAYAKNFFSFSECLSFKTILYHSFKDQGHYLYYSTWILCREFQALQLIFLATFGVVD